MARAVRSSSSPSPITSTGTAQLRRPRGTQGRSGERAGGKPANRCGRGRHDRICPNDSLRVPGAPGGKTFMGTVVERSRRFVVKIGSSLLAAAGEGLDEEALSRWAAQIAEMRALGREVVLVSSGAIAAGMKRLNWKKRPHALHQLQAAAAVGQMGLIQAYESCFRRHQLMTSQILLTHEDLAVRKRYLNARSTLRT